MLNLNLERIFSERGIQDAAKELMKLGISQPSVHRLLKKGVASINLEHLDKICYLLNCTPNDLLSWQPSAAQKTNTTHALNELKHDASQKPVAEILRGISIAQLNQLRQILDTPVK